MNIEYKKSICSKCYEEYRCREFIIDELAKDFPAEVSIWFESKGSISGNHPFLKALTEVLEKYKVMCLYISYDDSGLSLCKKHAQSLLDNFPKE